MKILILAYDFHPLISIGAQRPYSWYKYLPDGEISVTVVTRQWTEKISSPLDYVVEMPQKAYQESDGKGNVIIRAPFFPNKRDKMLVNFGLTKFALARKMLTYFYAFFEHLFFAFDNKATIYIEAQKAIEQNKPDFIIATAEPFILFKYAHLLSAKYNIPWIADYRDGWNTNQGNYSRDILSKLLSSFYTTREKKYIDNSLFITTAAPTYAAALQKMHPDKEIKVVYNGYDEEYIKGLDEILPVQDKFTIAYAGTIYPHQNLEMFLDGLNLFVKNEKISAGELKVCFYGSEAQPEALNRLLNYNNELKEYIVTTNKVPYGELLRKLRASHLLLLLSKKMRSGLMPKCSITWRLEEKLFW